MRLFTIRGLSIVALLILRWRMSKAPIMKGYVFVKADPQKSTAGDSVRINV